MFDRWLSLMGGAAGTLIGCVMLTVAVDVLLRHFFGRPLGWATEISEYSLLYITFLGAAWVLRNHGHVRVDVITRLITPRGGALLGLVTSVVGGIGCLVLTVYGIQVTWELVQRGARSPTLLRFPQAPVVAVIPFGSLFLTIEFSRQALRSLRNWKSG